LVWEQTQIIILSTNNTFSNSVKCQLFFNTMNRILRLIGIISLANSIGSSRGNIENLIPELTNRLEHFALCNIHITAEFKTIAWDWESSFLPTTLDEIVNNHNWTFFNLQMRSNPNSSGTIGPRFKYRDIICTLQLVVHPSHTAQLFRHYTVDYRHLRIYDKYLVFVWYHAEFVRTVYRDIMHHENNWIYVWTITPKLFNNVVHFLFEDIFYILSCRELTRCVVSLNSHQLPSYYR